MTHYWRILRALGSLRPLGLLCLGLVVSAMGCGSDDSSPGGSSAGGTTSGGSAGESGSAGEAGDASNGGTSNAGGTSGAGGTSNAGGTCGDNCPVDEACGDGERDAAEACDDGNIVDGDGCDSFCQVELQVSACGDGEITADEECDDANLLGGDGCDSACRNEECGNDRVDAGEECDPPVADQCSASCLQVSPNCGDGEVQTDEFEQCDDENDEPADGCHLCRVTCGNGRVEGNFGEDCEPTHSPTTCTEACQWLPVCGDGSVQPEAGEECDPSNGVTCVDCKVEVPNPPDCEGGAAGASSSDEECPPDPEECVPAEPGDLVNNGDFDQGSASWLPHSTFISLNPISEGVPDPDALEIVFATLPERSVSGAFQCLPIEPGAEYELAAEYLIPSDAHADVTANITVLLYAGPGCSGDWVRPPGNGPAGRERDVWSPYQWVIDTSTLWDLGEVTEAHLLLRLNVVQPGNVSGSRIVWDNVSLIQSGSLCGDCSVDEGETCDDGNQTAGDGCSRSCDREVCGDEIVQTPEQCDDGDNQYALGDACSPACRQPTACDDCALARCPSQLGDASLLDDCWLLEGEAESGPAAGSARSLLCDQLRACAQRTACAAVPRTTEGVSGAFLENCYCGSAGDHCFDTSGLANGSCQREVEAALESTDPIAVFERMSGADPDFPIFANVGGVLACEMNQCTECTPPSICGDGREQDRNFAFQFEIDGQNVDCRDDLTHTGRGCSFEECDDGNLNPGDGCDANCFIEACGNYVVQGDEQCDDGNRESGDGCNAECKAEYTCGDSILEEPFEECDPPAEGSVCTPEQYQADPSSCGCDDQCQYVVCGNGEVQRPAEQCDPPDDIVCTQECQVKDAGACEECINTIPYVGEFNQDFCNTDPLCFAVKQCALAPLEDDPGTTCYDLPAVDCYCGFIEDFSVCEEPDFEPLGPCAAEIIAGHEPGIPNAELIARWYSFDYPAGRAMAIAEEARLQCAADCGF